jgi:hypothetical protein
MQCRRRWNLVTLFAIVATVTATSSAFAALDYAKKAAELETAKPPQTAEIQNQVVKDVQDELDLRKRNELSRKVADNFERLLTSRSNDVQLNAAMTIARLHTIFTDAPLKRMLGHNNPAIRYWAAKGLAEIPNLKEVGGAPSAITALEKQLEKETSGTVKKEIVRAVAALGDVNDLIKVLEILSASMQATMPDQMTIDAATSALNEIDAVTRTAPAPKDAANIARATATLVSFATQQEFAVRSKDPASISDGYHAAVVNLVNTAVKVLNDAAGKSVFTGVAGDSKPEEFLLLVNGIVGSGAVPGKVQTTFQGVTIPPAIKPPAAPTTTSRPAPH